MKLLNPLILLLDDEFLFLLTVTFCWFSLFDVLNFKAPTFLPTFISSTINDIQKIATEKAEKINGGNDIDEVEEVVAVNINNSKSTSAKENRSLRRILAIRISWTDLSNLINTHFSL